jgi:hypothetical protein
MRVEKKKSLCVLDCLLELTIKKLVMGEGGNQNPANLGPDFYEKSFV